LANDTSADDVINLMSKLNPADMLIFESELSGQRKALMAVGKKNDQLELLFIDRATINQILANKDLAPLLNEALAAETNNNAAIQEIISQISQVVAKIIANNHELFVIISGRPDSSTTNIISSTVSKIEQCVGTSGTWYRFPDVCTSNQETCDATKCTPSGNNLVDGCKCPSDKCLNGGQCVKK